MKLAFRFGENVEVLTEGFFFQRKGVVVSWEVCFDTTGVREKGAIYTVSFSAQGVDPVLERFKEEELKKLT